MPIVDADVSYKVLGTQRLGMLFEVGQRTDHCKAKVWTNSHRNHVLGKLLAHAYARVEALCHDIGQAVIAEKLDLNIWIFREKWLELWPKSILIA